jgi:hypothetical protein
MSSPKAAVAAALIGLGLLGLAGCQVRPLYASAPGEAGPQADLPAISVDEPVSREEQVYRNALLFGLRGGADPALPRYTLAYRITVQEQGVAVERGTGTPNTYQLIGGSSFLVRTRDGFVTVRRQRDGRRVVYPVVAELCQHPGTSGCRRPPCDIAGNLTQARWPLISPLCKAFGRSEVERRGSLPGLAADGRPTVPAYGDDAGAITERARLIERLALARGGAMPCIRIGSESISVEPGSRSLRNSTPARCSAVNLLFLCGSRTAATM